jgi:lysosomal acid lipase/cholesteryl ester hydrolase
MFADAGFDVWLGNFRGNTYGSRHVNLTTSQHAFWEFSWDEMAKYDLPAMIDYVLEHTGQTELYYMGHSEGTMTAFAHLSESPDFTSKVKRFFALGPVATVKHIGGLLHYIAPFTNELEWLVDMIGINDFLPNNWFMKLIAKYVCGNADLNILCDDVLFLIGGANSHQLNKTRVPVYMAHTPAGTSSQNIIHFGQGVISGLFQMYNYGEKGNVKHYGEQHRHSPPIYDIAKVTVPTYLFWGELDILADPTDIKDSIIPYLPNLQGDYSFADFNHLDFIWGLNAGGDVYSKILSIIKEQDGIGN